MDTIPIASRAATANRKNSATVFDRAGVNAVFVVFHIM
jgi:hypothetical protein